MEEDPQRYCYIFSRPNESINIIVEWLAEQREATSKRVSPPEIAEVNIPHATNERERLSTMQRWYKAKISE